MPTKFLTGKALAKKITSIGHAGVTLHNNVQLAGASCIAETVKRSGNITALNDCFKALPASYRRDSFVHWVCDFGPFKFDSDKGKFGLNKGWEDAPELFDAEGAMSVDWLEHGSKLLAEKNAAAVDGKGGKGGKPSQGVQNFDNKALISLLGKIADGSYRGAQAVIDKDARATASKLLKSMGAG